MMVHVVEIYDNAPYGEFFGIHGVYESKEEAEEVEDDKYYQYLVSSHKVKKVKR